MSWDRKEERKLKELQNNSEIREANKSLFCNSKVKKVTGETVNILIHYILLNFIFFNYLPGILKTKHHLRTN